MYWTQINKEGAILMHDHILSINELHTYFQLGRRRVKAVNGVTLNVRRGKILGMVGESGCGKSVTAHSIMQLLPKSGRIINGEIIFRPKGKEGIVLTKYKRNDKRLRAIRGKDISMIFQDPMSSLNPVYTIGKQIIENIQQHEKVSKKIAMKRAIDMLDKLGIPLPDKRVYDYPHQFSGGMKQRVMIAMGMICNPELLIADEPTTALDVTIQAQILDLMQEMQKEYGITIILITHNMGVVAEVADDVAVMYMGKIVEYGTKEQIFLEPAHPYTKALLRSVPVLGIGHKKRLDTIKGSIPDSSQMPEGCAFAPRCDFASEKCNEPPPYIDVGKEHLVRCWICSGGCLHE